MTKEPILVIDHDAARRAQLAELLDSRGFDAIEAAGCEEALFLLDKRPVPVIVCETDLPHKSGLFLLKEVRDRLPDTEVILLSRDTSSYSLLQALRLSAFDCILRPIDAGEILFASLDRAFAQIELKRQNERLIKELEKRNTILQQHLNMMKALGQSIEQLLIAAGTQELLTTLLACAIDEVKADRGFIALFDKEGESLGIKISRGIDPQTSKQFAKSLPQGVITQAALQNKPALVPHELPPEWRNRTNREERESLRLGPGVLLAPLRMRDRQAGIIAIYGHREGQPFTERDLMFLIQLSHHASLALTREGRIYTQYKGSNGG